MKKLVIVTAMLLLGFGSLSAQSAYEVKVDWTYLNSYCHGLVDAPKQYKIVVTCDINDLVNTFQHVSYSANPEAVTETTTTFTASQTQVETYCENDLDHVQDFEVIVNVYIIELSTGNVVCHGDKTITGLSCDDFAAGVYLSVPVG